MPDDTSGAPSRAALALRTGGFRLIVHEPVCPDCGSWDIYCAEVQTGDGLTETAHICRACGTAWPVACICDWTATATPAPTP